VGQGGGGGREGQGCWRRSTLGWEDISCDKDFVGAAAMLAPAAFGCLPLPLPRDGQPGSGGARVVCALCVRGRAGSAVACVCACAFAAGVAALCVVQHQLSNEPSCLLRCKNQVSIVRCCPGQGQPTTHPPPRRVGCWRGLCWGPAGGSRSGAAGCRGHASSCRRQRTLAGRRWRPAGRRRCDSRAARLRCSWGPPQNLAAPRPPRPQ
jgi:hypothetical protein